MSHFEINRSKEPIRLFASDILEFFTHVHPVTVLIVWVPVVVYFLVSATTQKPIGVPLFNIPLGFFAGLFFWTFIEYVGHRFVFHYPARTAWQERALFLVHGVHHAQPQVKTRLVLPPVVAIPLAAPFYGGFHLILDVALDASHWVAPLFSGFITGYVIYDMLHYATHHYPMRRGVLKFLKRYHLQHHFKTPDQRFGVTTPLWDAVFGTRPP